jgi:cold shock CspA family protein
MAKSQQTYNKNEREKLKQKRKEEKDKKKREKKDNPDKASYDMYTYVDENGNLSSTPPDPSKKIKVKAEDIELGVPKREPEEKEDPIKKGKISFFNTEKGYGFIKLENSEDSVFVHINGLIDSVKENDKVTFEVEQGMKGLNAVNVKLQ